MSEEERIHIRFLNWVVDKWYPATAFVYTMICVFDFVIFPVYIGLTREDPAVLVYHLKDLDVSVQRDLIAATIRDYTPLTLRGGGLFHVSFGALLSFGTIFKKKELNDG
tara:strand:- start:1159 stop:1485 length:327 start_codon:yes stop_codon:yes gene_type:complete